MNCFSDVNLVGRNNLPVTDSGLPSALLQLSFMSYTKQKLAKQNFSAGNKESENSLKNDAKKSLIDTRYLQSPRVNLLG